MTEQLTSESSPALLTDDRSEGSIGSGGNAPRSYMLLWLLLVAVVFVGAVVVRTLIGANDPLAKYCCGGDDAAPEKHLDEYLSRYRETPGDTFTLIQLGRAYLNLGYYDWSKTYFDSAAIFDSSSPLPAYGLAFVHMRMGNYDSSAISMRLCQGIINDTRSTHYFWGEWHRLQSRFDTAASEYMAALDAQPLNACTLNSIGINFKEQGNLTMALVYLDSAIALAPHESMFLANRYHVLDDLGRANEADRDLKAWRDLVGATAPKPDRLRSLIPGREPYGPF